eukprot:5737480-Prymnesium_polylepis.1
MDTYQADTSVSTNATPIPWGVVVREGVETVESCRSMLEAANASGEHPPDIVAELRGWLDVCRAPELADVTPQLRQACRRTDNP